MMTPAPGGLRQLTDAARESRSTTFTDARDHISSTGSHSAISRAILPGIANGRGPILKLVSKLPKSLFGLSIQNVRRKLADVTCTRLQAVRGLWS